VLLLQHAMCIASFILHWKLCHVPKVMTVPVQYIGCSSIPFHTLLDMQAEDILHCIHMHSLRHLPMLLMKQSGYTQLGVVVREEMVFGI
jgi:hypothetical protein